MNAPSPLLVATASKIPPGRALDLACGAGRNALWLARQAWTVTAVDNSQSAIDALTAQTKEMQAVVDTRLADLEKGEFVIEPAQWDLISICYYLQRDLFEQAKRGLIPGGVLLAIVLMIEPGKENSPYRAQPGELREIFRGWEILHDREGSDSSNHAVAEIVARRPNSDTI